MTTSPDATGYSDRPLVARCAECVFFIAGEYWHGPNAEDGVSDGACRRYPRTEGKDLNQWCGEFRQQGSAQ